MKMCIYFVLLIDNKREITLKVFMAFNLLAFLAFLRFLLKSEEKKLSK